MIAQRLFFGVVYAGEPWRSLRWIVVFFFAAFALSTCLGCSASRRDAAVLAANAARVGADPAHAIIEEQCSQMYADAEEASDEAAFDAAEEVCGRAIDAYDAAGAAHAEIVQLVLLFAIDRKEATLARIVELVTKVAGRAEELRAAIERLTAGSP